MDQEKTLATASSASTTTTISSDCHVSSNVAPDQLSTPTNESSSKPTKIPSSRFKGVVPQPNGRWGAQIYEKHQRVWLGTFAHEHEAARAYDVAAKRFRGRDAVVNFKAAAAEAEDVINDDDDHEEGFLSRHSKMEIVDMLRKHTYDEELEQSRRRSLKERESFFTGCFESLTGIDKTMKIKEVLFEKVVTPSDVGKLNRLVIPKQHAEKHFPLKNQTTNNNSNNNYNGSYLLNFEDVIGGKAWRFRYSYWNSSQSYVLTRGWSRFVKEKNLKAGDVVCFLRSSGGNNNSGGETQLYIDCNNRRSLGNGDDNVNCEVKTVIRIFGVDVCVDGFGGDQKRCCSEMEVLGLHVDCGKKQRIA